jgi:4-hydroxymandelate oxidase
MNRRVFTQLLSLGLGALGQDRADAGQPKPTSPAQERVEPVTSEDFKALAQAQLPKATFEYITTGSVNEITLRENVAAFQRIRLLPPLLTGVGDADLSTTVLKQRVALPVLLAPVAGQRMYHPQGGLASARAAAAAGTVFAVSSHVGNSVEEVVAVSKGPKWYQLYLPKDRKVARALLERVERAGYQALIVTVDLGDWMDANRRNHFAVPKEMLVKHLRDIGFDNINDRMSYQDILAFNERVWDLTPSWTVFDWLRSVTKLPLLIKGVLRTEDAKKAVALGLDGIIVSNHGGRRLDGVPAAIERLPVVAAAVAGRAEVYMDGGVRRGTDVLKALALGARAVLIGRPYAWALAADGEAGVRKVLEFFRQELLNTMVATGCAKVSEVHRSLLVTGG